MGIIVTPVVDKIEQQFVGEPEKCFFCGIGFMQKKEAVVYWSGYNAIIHLHTACSLKLGSYLIADAAVARDRARVARQKMLEKLNA